MKMYAPNEVSAVSVRGMQLPIDADGSVDVPFDVADELRSHGFTPEAPAKPLTPKEKSAADKAKAAAAKAYDDALAVLKTAQDVLADTEGRGDEKKTSSAQADVDAALETVKIAEAAL